MLFQFASYILYLSWLTVHTKTEEIPEVEGKAQRPIACRDTVALYHESSIHIEEETMERAVKPGVSFLEAEHTHTELTNEKWSRGDKHCWDAYTQPYL